jgi:hypothetical protein
MRSVLIIWIVLFTSLSFGQKRTDGESISFKRYKAEHPVKVVDFGVKANLADLQKDESVHYKYSNGEWHFIRTTSSHISELLQQGIVEQIYFTPVDASLLCDTMRIVQNIDSVHSGEFPLSTPYTGKDIIIGYVDSGLDLDHPDFQNADGTTRVLYYWDHSLPFDAQMTPSKYGYGQVWDSTQINAGQCTSTDNNAHGTTVTGAGSGNGLATGTNKGVAPDSDIIIVETNFSLPNWTLTVADGIDFVFAMADALGKPAVVNTSLGSYLGSHDGTDPAGQIVDSLLNDKRGRIVVAAAGNAGNQGKYHVNGTVTADTSFTWLEVNMSSGFGSPAVYLDLWADTADFSNVEFAFAADKTSPNFEFRGRTQFFSIQSLLGTTTFDSIMVAGNKLAPVELFCEEINGLYHIEALLENIDSTDYLYRFETTGSGKYDLWSGAWLGASDIKWSGLPTIGDFPPIAHYHEPDSLQTIVSSWSAHPSVVTVGNFTNQKQYLDFNSNLYVGAYPPGELSINSSKGPNRKGVVKPDVSASGDLILASCPLWLSASLQGSNPDMLAEGGMHVRNGGTSMASPVIAGIAALYLEKCPQASYQDFMNDLHADAYEDSWTQATPNFAYGYGKINAFELLTNTNFEAVLSGSDTLICADPEVFGTQNNHLSYLWYNGDTTATIEVIDADTIYVEVINQSGCTGPSDTIITTLGTLPTFPVISQVGGGLIVSPADSIQWYYEGNPIDSANTQFYNPDTTGDFTVQVWSTDGCSYLSDPYWADMSQIEELLKNEFIIFPNPFEDHFSILKSDFYDVYLYITDLSGKLVYNYTEFNSNDLYIDIDLSSYESGPYFMTIYYGDDFKTFKLIKK